MNPTDRHPALDADPPISPLPAISVIVCTRDRPEKLEQALVAVLAQATPDVEVIVVAHGQHDPAPLLNDRTRILSIGPKPRGAARSAGLHASRGSLIAYCDDVDIWQPGHLVQLREALDLDASIAAVYGTMNWVNERLEPVKPFIPDPWPGVAQTPHIFASALMHRADRARRVGGFDAYVNAFSEWDLCMRLSDWWRLEQVPSVRVLGRLDVEREEFAEEASQDRNRIASHAMGRRIRLPRHRPARSPRRTPKPFDAPTWSNGRRELSVRSVYSGRHSYASVNAGLLPALEQEGVSIFLGSPHSTPPPEFERYARGPGDDHRISLFYEVGSRPKVVGVGPLVQYTMMEQDLIPLVHVEEINRYVNLLFVPCQMCAESFRRGGVEVPIQVLHHGIDPGAFPLLERPEREVFTFGTFGQQNERKGVDVLLRAFQDEFGADESVRLILNATLSGPWLRVDAPRVEVRNAFLDRAGVLEYLRELDAMVLPSRGEGFGLCGLEAMATGLPTIATNWSGPADYLDPADSYPLSYRLVDTAGFDFGGMRLFGRWAEPSYLHLRALMRHLFDHREEGRAAGRRASARVHRDWRWERPAKQIVAAIDLLAAGASPVSYV